MIIGSRGFVPGFQSTLPLRGATFNAAVWSHLRNISIHAPLTGSDPQGDSPARIDEISIHAPLTGSDLGRSISLTRFLISIHAPLTGSDSASNSRRLISLDFNPRSPYGERLRPTYFIPGFLVISIHAPLTGSDSDALSFFFVI